jgi:hypothetical protein
MNRWLLLLAALLVACSPKKDTLPNLPAVKPTHNRIIVYQIMVRLFGNKLSVNKRFGTMAPKALNGLTLATVTRALSATCEKMPVAYCFLC